MVCDERTLEIPPNKKKVILPPTKSPQNGGEGFKRSEEILQMGASELSAIILRATTQEEFLPPNGGVQRHVFKGRDRIKRRLPPLNIVSLRRHAPAT